jgi:hypothetical protein
MSIVPTNKTHLDRDLKYLRKYIREFPQKNLEKRVCRWLKIKKISFSVEASKLIGYLRYDLGDQCFDSYAIFEFFATNYLNVYPPCDLTHLDLTSISNNLKEAFPEWFIHCRHYEIVFIELNHFQARFEQDKKDGELLQKLQEEVQSSQTPKEKNLFNVKTHLIKYRNLVSETYIEQLGHSESLHGNRLSQLEYEQLLPNLIEKVETLTEQTKKTRAKKALVKTIAKIDKHRKKADKESVIVEEMEQTLIKWHRIEVGIEALKNLLEKELAIK